MFELLEWWNKDAPELSPVLSSAVVHHRFETIHPFADGNGRTGRALALWELYRRGFDSHHIFAVDEFCWEDRPRYYAALDAVRREGDDLSSWVEYCAEGLRQTLERVWERMGQLSVSTAREKVVLRPAHLLDLIRNFTVFQQVNGRTRKVAARHQQFRAIHKAVRKLADGRTKTQGAERDERGGIVRHTQGSGNFVEIGHSVLAQLFGYRRAVATIRRQTGLAAIRLVGAAGVVAAPDPAGPACCTCASCSPPSPRSSPLASSSCAILPNSGLIPRRRSGTVSTRL